MSCESETAVRSSVDPSQIPSRNPIQKQPVSEHLFPLCDRSRTRTQSVTAKVSPADEKALQTRAQQEGLTLSEWARQTLLRSLKVEPGIRLMLAEIFALRKIVLALQIDLLQDREPTEERIRAVIEQADLTKASLVYQRVQAFLSQTLETTR